MSQGLKPVRTQSDCGDEYCIYLPLIVKPPLPVRIASSWPTSGRAGDVYVQGQIENVANVIDVGGGTFEREPASSNYRSQVFGL